MNIHSLRFKLTVYFLILIIVPMLVVSYFFYQNSTHIIEEKISESVSTTLLMIETSIENVLEQSRFVATPFLVNTKNREFLEREIHLSDYEDLNKLNQIMSDLKGMEISGQNIYSISLYNSINRMLLTSEKNMFFYPNEEMNHIEKLIAEEGGAPRWFLEKWPSSTYLTARPNYITYPISLDPSESGIRKNILFVHVSESTISEYIKNLNKTDNGLKTLILTKDGRSIVQTNIDKNKLFSVEFGEQPSMIKQLDRITSEKEGSFSENFAGREVLVVFRTSEKTGFKYVNFVPREDWNKEITNLRNGVIVLDLLAALAAMLLAYLFMKSIYNPMFRLLKAMKQTVDKKDFDYQIIEQRKDEFGILFLGFNAMIRNIQQLIKNLYQEKLLKQEFELKLMQSRMNPHFLYNTLNSIYSIAKLHGVHEVTDMAYALSHFFRHSLKGDDWITVKEMLDHIDNYLKIQKIRYRDKFEVSIDVEDELMDMPILKLLLQPLVENAIIHGVEMKGGKGAISITGYQLDESVVFVVSDDGLGMTTQRLEEIREHLKSGGGSSSELFALSNVDQRIKHYYGEGYGLEIFSQLNKGTTIEVYLPAYHRRDDLV
ncbi:histidine kinase [Paenibacillus alginolyticus]|uniref:Histidine kinase n=1 Tax=Paenibacillus alginolyticus TaxID=59839 RepID=A0ABT4GGG4_9BACL|nr:histidine kinase [Paenibacillus alginolyticus]MCY9668381.1 histidine kinase [Paenibacillus alginolyticus]MCY9695291.1 histidine kinase [Paenibacillus alginolyticus]MEC0144817.1 histidine kinase [Paenibacillus alginolyticus]